MDAKEARRFTTINPPIDREAERRPSLLGRLFRRSSSIDEAGMNMPTDFANMGSRRMEEAGDRRGSITEAVHTHFLSKKGPDPEFSIFT